MLLRLASKCLAGHREALANAHRRRGKAVCLRERAIAPDHCWLGDVRLKSARSKRCLYPLVSRVFGAVLQSTPARMSLYP